MKLNELTNRVHQQALAMGWHDKPRTALEIHMLIVSEVAEATEAVRNSEPDFYIKESGKPEGESVELADALIRILDYAGSKGWDMEKIIDTKLKYNATRGYKHGGKAL